MRVFVTGATGFIGRALIPRLQREGHAVVAWVRWPARARGLLGAGVELVHADTAPDGLVAAPLEDTFAFFSKAANLGVITPAAMRFAIQGQAPPMAAGAVIDYRVRVGPLPVRWRTRITAWEPGRRFADLQEKGPYHFWWHEHTFQADGPLTVMEDRVYYTPSLGIVGRLANRVFIGSTLRNIFQYRGGVIRLRFGVS